MKQNQKNRYNGRYNNRNARSMILRNTVMESTGPMGKIHGTALQLFEKYQAYAKDFLIQNDVVMAQTCMQYADHYMRLQNMAIANEQSLRQNHSEQRSHPVADKNANVEIAKEDVKKEDDNEVAENTIQENEQSEVVVSEITVSHTEEVEVKTKEKKEKPIKKQQVRKSPKHKESEDTNDFENDDIVPITAEEVLSRDLSVPIAVMQENNEMPVKTKKPLQRTKAKQPVS